MKWNFNCSNTFCFHFFAFASTFLSKLSIMETSKLPIAEHRTPSMTCCSMTIEQIVAFCLSQFLAMLGVKQDDPRCKNLGPGPHKGILVHLNKEPPIEKTFDSWTQGMSWGPPNRCDYEAFLVRLSCGIVVLVPSHLRPKTLYRYLASENVLCKKKFNPVYFQRHPDEELFEYGCGTYGTFESPSPCRRILADTRQLLATRHLEKVQKALDMFKTQVDAFVDQHHSSGRPKLTCFVEELE